MPLVGSTYDAPWPLRNGHLATLFPHFFRSVPAVDYARERIETADGDFLDLDWSRAGAGRLAIVTHGLEGSTRRGYIRGMVHALNRRGWDVLAWNLRGCSGQPNRLPHSYHSGATRDLEAVVQHARTVHGYEHLALVGFSLGGNLTLKYLGEQGAAAPVRAAAAFSVPCDLASSAAQLARLQNRHFTYYFLRKLRQTVRAKQARHPEVIDEAAFSEIQTLADFDDRYTAPLNDFESAQDYYRKASSRLYLPQIRVPTLLVNAADDPFLAPPSYPHREAEANTHFFLEVPVHGGHVGFATPGRAAYWSERRAAAFLEDEGRHEEEPRDEATFL